MKEASNSCALCSLYIQISRTTHLYINCILNKKKKTAISNHKQKSYFPATKGTPLTELAGISPCKPGIISVIVLTIL